MLSNGCIRPKQSNISFYLGENTKNYHLLFDWGYFHNELLRTDYSCRSSNHVFPDLCCTGVQVAGTKKPQKSYIKPRFH